MSTKRLHTHSTYKSAKDGKFVTKEFARKHPATTFKETTRNPKKKKYPFLPVFSVSFTAVGISL